MTIQLQIDNTQSKFFMDLLSKLGSVVKNITIIDKMEDKDEKSILMNSQSENGFSKNVLSQKSEDIWNDI